MPPKDKEKLQTFLIKHLDEGRTKGIRWVNNEAGIFQLLWLHANCPEWCEEDGALHKEWAIYKGRYKQQPDGTWPEADYTNWKANFRCAVNRCHAFEEIKVDTGNKDLKTYKFIPRRHEDASETHQPFPDTTWQNEDSEEKHMVVVTTSTSQGTTTQPYPARMPVNMDTSATVAFTSDAEAQFLPEVLKSLPVTHPASTGIVLDDRQPASPDQPDLFQPMDNEYGPAGMLQFPNNADRERNVNSLMDQASLEATGLDPEHISNVSLPDSLSQLRFVNSKPEMIDMVIWLRYREKVVGKQYIRCDKGSRIMNADGEKRSEIPEKFTGIKLVGTPAAAVHVHGDTENTERILQALGNGLHLFCDRDGDIYATRLTGCRIYCADPTLRNAAEPQLLPRKQTVKVFDRDTFSKKLAAWEKNKTSGERPSVSILFSLGENWSLLKPINKCCVNVMVIHCYSWAQIMSVKYIDIPQLEEDVEAIHGMAAVYEAL